MGQKMVAIYKSWRTSDLGYKYQVTHYRAQNCLGCSMRGACNKQKGNRTIEVNHKLIIYKQKARENLLSEKGVELRGRRCTEVEQTFGQLKWNKKFNRFFLKGLEKVVIETALLALAHNFQKLSVLMSGGKIVFAKSAFFIRLFACILKNILQLIIIEKEKIVFTFLPIKLKKAA